MYVHSDIYVHVYFKEMMGYKSYSVPSVISYTCNPRVQGCGVVGRKEYHKFEVRNHEKERKWSVSPLCAPFVLKSYGAHSISVLSVIYDLLRSIICSVAVRNIHTDAHLVLKLRHMYMRAY